MPPVGMNGKSSKNRGQSHGMAKFQCWTIRSNVILFSYIIFLFSPAFIKQSIPSSFIMVFFLPYFVCYFVSNFFLFGTLVMCTIFFIDVGRRRVTRSNFLFVQLQFLVSGVYRFSLASAWIWAWTFYVFIPSFFFCCRFQTSHSFYFNAFVFLAFFFHSFIYWLHCRWRQLSPSPNGIIFILRSTTRFKVIFFFFWLFPRTVQCNVEKKRCQFEMISDQFSSSNFVPNVLEIHNAATRVWLRCVYMSGNVQFSILQYMAYSINNHTRSHSYSELAGCWNE